MSRTPHLAYPGHGPSGDQRHLIGLNRLLALGLGLPFVPGFLQASTALTLRERLAAARLARHGVVPTDLRQARYVEALGRQVSHAGAARPRRGRAAAVCEVGRRAGQQLGVVPAAEQPQDAPDWLVRVAVGITMLVVGTLVALVFVAATALGAGVPSALAIFGFVVGAASVPLTRRHTAKLIKANEAAQHAGGPSAPA